MAERHTKKISRTRAGRNRTIELSPEDESRLRRSLVFKIGDGHDDIQDKIVCGDAFEALTQLPKGRFDLLFADPPYNLTKAFGIEKFRETSVEAYETWLDSWITLCVPLLKKTASIYICGDWRSSSAIQRVGSSYFELRSRITWEREKGRGAKANWKNAAEDIWFFTVSDSYTFNLDAVKQRRRVIAPYRDNGRPKDWSETDTGKFRDTHPSNIWTDITVPFWSMPENTDHPTQKPEKLLAKIILASTNEDDLILDPFAGSGTTAAVAKKFGRRFVVIESDQDYCLLAARRLEIAEADSTIQGFADGVFWERNSNK
ncbi:MAG TPA: DNA methyltransferase [Pyrinomonadaceae bacterium]|nr:DNA methyltransferase [Pyrinomonadaceae bacterium]